MIVAGRLVGPERVQTGQVRIEEETIVVITPSRVDTQRAFKKYRAAFFNHLCNHFAHLAKVTAIMQSDEKAKLELILQRIIERKDSLDFREPVDVKGTT